MKKKYESYSLYNSIIEVVTKSPSFTSYLQNSSTFIDKMGFSYEIYSQLGIKTKRDKALNSLLVLFFETCKKAANACRKTNSRKGTLSSDQKTDLIRAIVFFKNIISNEIDKPENLIQKFENKKSKFFKDFNLRRFEKDSNEFNLLADKKPLVEESSNERFQNKKREDSLLKRLWKDPKAAVAYLNDLLQDDDKGLFLDGLRECVKANGGFTELAQKTGIKREALYRGLSEGGNPKLSTLDNVLNTLGYEIKLVASSKKIKKTKN